MYVKYYIFVLSNSVELVASLQNYVWFPYYADISKTVISMHTKYNSDV